MATKKDIFEIISKIKYLPNSPVTDRNIGEIVEMFFSVLKDLSFPALNAACLQYLGEENPFFPMPGMLRSKALDLQLMALKIPTPTEAWGMVMNCLAYKEPVFCDENLKIRHTVKQLIGGEYLLALRILREHEEGCQICIKGGFISQFGHPAVAETVRRLGGLDVVMTGNPVPDRARFIDGYNEVLAQERMRLGMQPEVREFVAEQSALAEERRAALETGEREHITNQYKRLAGVLASN